MKIRLNTLLGIADELEGCRCELGEVIDLAEVKPGHFAPRERPSVAVRRVAQHFEQARERVRQWQKR